MTALSDVQNRENSGSAQVLGKSVGGKFAQAVIPTDTSGNPLVSLFDDNGSLITTDGAFYGGRVGYIFGGTGVAYTDGDTIGTPQQVTSVGHGVYRLDNLVLTTSATGLFGTNHCEVLFFSCTSAPTGVAADNAPWSIDLAAEILTSHVRGAYSLTGSGDYGAGGSEYRFLENPSNAPKIAVDNNLWVLVRGGNGVAIGMSDGLLLDVAMSRVAAL